MGQEVAVISPAAADESDAVFLPPDCLAVLSRADGLPVEEICASEKELFSWLCDHPVLLDGGIMSFWLERRSGAKCYVLSARALDIVWGDEPSHWIWTSLPNSRFPEVAELLDVCWLEITGKIQRSWLSPGTTYAAYLLFAMADFSYGFGCHVGMRLPKASVTVAAPGDEEAAGEHAVCFQHLQGSDGERAHRRGRVFARRRKDFGFGGELVREAMDEAALKCARRRADGWLEVELGQFSGGGEEGVVEVSLREVEEGQWKRGLIVEGIEIRPKP